MPAKSNLYLNFRRELSLEFRIRTPRAQSREDDPDASVDSVKRSQPWRVYLLVPLAVRIYSPCPSAVFRSSLARSLPLSLRRGLRVFSLRAQHTLLMWCGLLLRCSSFVRDDRIAAAPTKTRGHAPFLYSSILILLLFVCLMSCNIANDVGDLFEEERSRRQTARELSENTTDQLMVYNCMFYIYSLGTLSRCYCASVCMRACRGGGGGGKILPITASPPPVSEKRVLCLYDRGMAIGR